MIGREAALKLLGAIPDPAPTEGRSGASVVATGRVSGVVSRDDGTVGLVLSIDGLSRAVGEQLEARITAALRAQPGVTGVRIIQTADRGRAADAGPAPQASALPGVRRIMLVGAGKGGVGKTTVAVGLALAFQRRGLSVGLLDADIHGPSAHILLGITGPVSSTSDRKILPMEAHGIQMLGMGVMADPDKAVAWRGPMIAGAVLQMATLGLWRALDVLVVDLPPGTGDIHLSLAQKLSPAGAVVVTTPQGLARADARRAVAFFEQLSVPVLGILENMAGSADGGEGPFGPPGGAADCGAGLLASLPHERDVVAASDSGRPLATGALARGLDGVAATLAARLSL